MMGKKEDLVKTEKIQGDLIREEKSLAGRIMLMRTRGKTEFLGLTRVSGRARGSTGGL